MHAPHTPMCVLVGRGVCLDMKLRGGVWARPHERVLQQRLGRGGLNAKCSAALCRGLKPDALNLLAG